MRIIGYILMLLGFLWLAIWCAGSVGPLTRAIGIENFKKYQPTQTYSGVQVQDAIRSVLTEYEDNAHGVIVPALLMFVGGVILDLAGRRSAKRKSPNTSLEPTPTASPVVTKA